MAGRFEGLNDLEWKLFEDIFATSSAHRWLKRWQTDGTMEKLQNRILEIAEEKAVLIVLFL